MTITAPAPAARKNTYRTCGYQRTFAGLTRDQRIELRKEYRHLRTITDLPVNAAKGSIFRIMHCVKEWD